VPTLLRSTAVSAGYGIFSSTITGNQNGWMDGSEDESEREELEPRAGK
jgi:hypothetical protein